MKTTGGHESAASNEREGTSTWTPKMLNDSDRFAAKEEEVVR